MPERDRPAIDVEPGWISPQHLEPGAGHRGKGFVDFIQVDIVKLHPRTLQRALRRADRRLQHDHRVFTDHRHVMDPRHRLDAQRLQPAFVDDHHARGAIADLRRSGRGQSAALLDQLDAANRLEAGIETDAFVDGVQLGLAVMGRHVYGHDFAVKRPGVGGGGTAPLAFIAEFVEHILGEIIFLGDHFGAGELAELDARVARLDPRPAEGRAHAVVVGQFGGGAHRHPRHRFDAGSDDDVHLAAHHRGSGEMQRLLRGAALAVNAGARHRFGQARRHHRVACDIARLLPELRHAAHDDVFDQRRIGTGTVDQCIEHLASKIGRMPITQQATAATPGSTGGGNDIGFMHGRSPKWRHNFTCHFTPKPRPGNDSGNERG